MQHLSTTDSRFNFYINSSSAVVIKIPLGKPNGRLPRGLGPDTRERAQPKMTFQLSNCGYAAFALIRERYGKCPCPEFAEERKFEVLCSARRKLERNQLALSPDIRADAQYADPQLLHGEAVASTKKYIALHPEYAIFRDMMIAQAKHALLLMNEKILMEKFGAYIKINTDFLLSLGKNQEDLYREALLNNTSFSQLYQVRPWSQLKTFEKFILLNNFVIKVSAECYKLNPSTWQPSEPIKGLIRDLKNNGPIVVSGNLGRPSYEQNPSKMTKRFEGNNVDVLYWSKGAKRAEGPIGHVIVIIGAESEDPSGRGGYVYYLDPTDISDPADSRSQKIYVTSYQNLTEHMTNYLGIRYNPQEQNPSHTIYGWQNRNRFSSAGSQSSSSAEATPGSMIVDAARAEAMVAAALAAPLASVLVSDAARAAGAAAAASCR